MKCPCAKGIPGHLTERISELCRPIVQEMGQVARDEGCVITDDLYDLLGHATAIIAITVAHDILQRRNELAGDIETAMWIEYQKHRK